MPYERRIQRCRAAGGWACAVLLGVGCSDARVGSWSGDANDTGEASASGLASTSGPSTDVADDTGGDMGADTSGAIFVAEPDLGDGSECSVFAQDCPVGFKCMPWASDGGNVWNEWGCKPLADEPAGVGESCHVEGSGSLGIDDCDLASMCWDVDPETHEGTCVPFCAGSEEAPTCEDPKRGCVIVGDGTISILCHSICNPLYDDCGEGEVCIDTSSVDSGWVCATDVSGESGAYGDPCAFLNGCEPGLICVSVGEVAPGEACEGAAGCCTEICDLTDPAGDQQCAGAADGQVCQPWYEAGDAPPGYETVGVCAVPA